MTTVTGKVNYNPLTGVLTLTTDGRTSAYEVERFDSELGGTAYALVKVAAGEAVERYDVLVGSHRGHFDGCSCPDATYRQRACKHYKAIQANRPLRRRA